MSNSGVMGRWAVVLLLLHSSAWIQAKEKIILDHDGGIDDFSAQLMLSRSEKFELSAVTIQPADCFLESAVWVTRHYLNLVHLKHVPVGISDFEGKNPFPDVWRKDSDHVEQMLKKQAGSTPIQPPLDLKTLPRAPELLVRLLSGKEKYTLVLTGPLSNLAAALKLQPNIVNNIRHAYLMGGAVRVAGNVDAFPKAGEWNFYNNPEAARDVINSGIKITLVSLDATNQVKVKDPLAVGSKPILEHLKERYQLSGGSLFAPQIFQLWNVVNDLIQNGIYCFWDTLTAAVAIRPDIVKTQKMRIRVRTDQEFAGRTVVTENLQDGAEVEVALGVNKSLLQDVLLRVWE
jgi:purine nucleosidase